MFRKNSSHHDNRVQDDGGRVDEQIDKNTGAQVSAQALTWSYANVRTIHLILGGQDIMFVFIIILILLIMMTNSNLQLTIILCQGPPRPAHPEEGCQDDGRPQLVELLMV